LPLPPSGLVPLDDLSRGALAYVVARVLTALGRDWTLRNIAELSQLEAAAVEDCVVYPIGLQLGSVTLQARVYIPERIALANVPERVAIRSLHAMRVTLSARGGRAWLPLSTLPELAQGDVIVLDDTALIRGQGEHWRGEVSAGLFGSRSHLRCVLEEQGLRVEGYAQTQIKELSMTTGQVQKAGDTTTQTSVSDADHVATDAPIELQVEIARFSLSLGELQRLQPGDVLITGRRIGERVSVQVGGQAFAQGELVDVEGEIGVRLLSFSEPKGA
jgi:type III secretion system YscQ/HrcQ family protein